MLTTWTDGVLEIEVDVEGIIEVEGRQWEVGSALCANFKKAPNHVDSGRYYPVIREADNTTEYFFLADYNKTKTSSIVFHPRPAYSTALFSPLSVWEEFMPWALQLKAPCRVLWFNAEATETVIPKEAEWCLTLLSDGSAGWTRAQISTSQSNTWIPFNRESDAPVLETTGTQDWAKWVKTALQTESDCRFAFEFGVLSREQKWQRVLRWKRGNLQQLTWLCEMIAYSVIEWNVNDGVTYFRLAIKPEELHILPDLSDLNPADVKRAQRLYAWAYQLYIAPFDASLYSHPSVCHWLEDPSQLIKFFIVPLSAHERMEKINSLIQWAQGEGIDNELREILNSPQDD